MIRLVYLFFSAYLASSVFLTAQAVKATVADRLYTLGNYSQAINEYAKYGTPEASLQIARSYNAMGNFDNAIDQYKHILRTDETNVLAQFELGKLYLNTNRHKKASNLFEKLIKRDAKNPEFHYYYGQALFLNLKVNEGMAAYKAAIRLDSTHLRSMFKVAKWYLVKTEIDSVLHYCDLGLLVYNDDVALLNLKGQAFFNREQYDLSNPIFERLLELGENRPHIYKKLGYGYFRDLKPGKAVQAYRKLAETPYEMGNAYFGIGEVYLEEKVLDSAAFYFKKAIAEKIVRL